ncbi:MAG TPA: hypothetical protein VMR73_01405 [Candidatus Paceibacterota bacterium]|nr:hypothetical protein [Candidatus Paceibacterota bacterium]
MKYVKKLAVAAGVFLLPAIASAQYSITNSTSLFSAVLNIINSIIPIIIALAVIFIIWYIVMSFTTNDETKRGTAHIHLLYSVIGLFVIVSIWGLVNILVGTTGLNNTPTNQIPNVTQLNNGSGI